MNVKMSKKAQAVWAEIQAGAQYVMYSSAMGSSADYIRQADGSQRSIPKMVAYQLPLCWMYQVSNVNSCQVWAAK